VGSIGCGIKSRKRVSACFHLLRQDACSLPRQGNFRVFAVNRLWPCFERRVANFGLQLAIKGRNADPIWSGQAMTQTSSAATSVNAGDFRVGAVISRSRSMLWRHFPTFFAVGVIASLPILLLVFTETDESADEEILSDLLWMLILVSLMVFSTIGQAVIIHASFQDMRRGPVRLVESLNVVLRGFWSLIGLALAGLLTLVGLMLMIVPGLILSTLWFVMLPACIVEQLGPWTSLRRSQELTRGHRWKVFGLTVLLIIATFGGSSVIESWVTAATNPIVGRAGEVMWTGIWMAFTATTTIATYRYLRVTKEGIDIEPIAVVFD
jgi:hypothetical protein